MYQNSKRTYRAIVWRCCRCHRRRRCLSSLILNFITRLSMCVSALAKGCRSSHHEWQSVIHSSILPCAVLLSSIVGNNQILLCACLALCYPLLSSSSFPQHSAGNDPQQAPQCMPTQPLLLTSFNSVNQCSRFTHPVQDHLVYFLRSLPEPHLVVLLLSYNQSLEWSFVILG